MIPKHVIDEIMSVARIEEVISDFVALRKSGADLKALSPFANEKTPSFYVSPAKQIFKDFSSGKGGNVVTFLMEHEQISYPEALRFLARRYQIPVPEEKELSVEELQSANEKESIYIVLEHALQFYKKELQESGNGRAIGKTYFYERGFRDDTIEKFGLGFSHQDWDKYTKTALSAGYKLEYLEKAGLTKTNESGQQYDMFRGRVIFPIHNMTGKVVAFAGRQLGKADKGPKYLNSPESPVYHKSDILYGLFFAKNAIRIADKCFLVEGYTDVITLNQAGIENVVASSGTSLTEGQIRQIKRFTPNITVLYDGDPAGLKASQRGIDLILSQGQNVRLVIFPDGEDPDSYCKKVGGEAFSAYIEAHEQDFILFKSQLLMGESGRDPLKKAEAVKSIVESIALIPDPLKRSVFAQECARIMEVPEQVIVLELNKSRRKELDKESRQVLEARDLAMQMQPEEDTLAVLLPGTEEQEKALMRILVRYGSLPYSEDQSVADFLFSEIQEGMEFSDALCRKMLDLAQAARQEGAALDETFFSLHADGPIASFAADALIDKYHASPDWEEKHSISMLTDKENYKKDLYSSLLHYKARKIEVIIEENRDALKNAVEEEEQERLLLRQMHLLSLRKQLSEYTGTIVIK